MNSVDAKKAAELATEAQLLAQERNSVQAERAAELCFARISAAAGEGEFKASVPVAELSLTAAQLSLLRQKLTGLGYAVRVFSDPRGADDSQLVIDYTQPGAVMRGRGLRRLLDEGTPDQRPNPEHYRQ